jgi:phosphate transport system protein
MKRHLDKELKQLNTELLKMAAMAEEAIYKSIEALKNRDKQAALAVIKSDKRLDELELKIERLGIDLLALRQPIAIDLRFIMTGMKINSELERIADLAVNISQRVLEVADRELLKPLIDIPKLSAVARKMLKDVIDAFVNRDQELAKKVILADSEADRLRNAIYDELVNDFIVKDGKCAPRAIPLMLVARHLERICDHVTYIATDIIYMVEGKDVKHHLERLFKKNNK